MKIEKLKTDTMIINEAENLDPITVFFIPNGEGAGRIIIQCYGQAWTAYWGNTGCTLKQFISEANYDYIAEKLDHPSTDEGWYYLCRIVKAIQEALKLEIKE